MSERNRTPTRSLKEDEYFNPADGLIYCALCRTPRQAVVNVQGSTFVPNALCRCQAAARELYLAEEKKRERMQEIERLRAAGLQDRALRNYTFANDLGWCPEIEKARAYVDRFREMEQDATGLLLWGDLGTGKTFFAGCIANALIEQGIPVLMTSFARVLNSLTGFRPEDRNEFVDSLNNYRLLVIDDLGVERNTEFSLEQVFHVIDSRYRSRLPMIVTTNLSLRELKQPADLAHARIYDRILERCVPIKINGQNHRQHLAADQLKKARILLGGPREPGNPQERREENNLSDEP